MGFRETLMHNLTQLVVERPAARRTAAEWAQALEASVAAIDAKAASAKNAAAAQAGLRHIIGIERWGQSRLRVFLGAPLVVDEYDGYAPAEGLSVAALRDELRAARAETVALAQQVAAANLAPGATVLHNQFGPLSARGWLQYLNSHASREAWRIR